ncbi:protein of unknown function [Draconibacterium orientale]|uniref:DUF4834 domain-containing protein n=1 Tax=Draconibacterium orientale TaxID=1168034 RepID=X5DGW5_9BACT|nr:DUF4834 family protein [Draconibacterium orientale]AHW59702.1 hypothetical protein FH5T_09125 [Draconibacterium orientale]SES78447.1 protein of unknown function [Draconibacterium orientale]
MTLFITLYIVGFLRTLVIIAVIYFGFRFIVRYLFPKIIDKGMKNMQQKMQEQQRQQHPKRPEGEVTVENRRSSNRNNQDNGEYVDFEEVD